MERRGGAAAVKRRGGKGVAPHSSFLFICDGGEGLLLANSSLTVESRSDGDEAWVLAPVCSLLLFVVWEKGFCGFFFVFVFFPEAEGGRCDLGMVMDEWGVVGCAQSGWEYADGVAAMVTTAVLR